MEKMWIAEEEKLEKNFKMVITLTKLPQVFLITGSTARIASQVLQLNHLKM